jgi:trans-AT polyketide synthase/acyltransferase/oxidoreductase domain-containing protein
MMQAAGGGMAAVIGMTVEQVEEVLQSNDAVGIDVANYNSPTQIVISGPREEIDRLQPLFQPAGARICMRLNVSGAFHSRYMEPARREFEAFLDSFELHEPRIPVISNVGAQLYTKDTAKKLLAEQITNPVNWTGIVKFLLAQGEEDFTEIGPGRVLTDLIKQIRNIPRS